jgi:SnoaL-like domain
VTVSETTRLAVCERMAAALGTRDYDGLASCFAEDATLRAIVPPGLREDDGREAIATRFERWTGAHANYALSGVEVVPVADLVRVRWIVTGDDPELDYGPSTFEQTAYAEIDESGLIARMRLACSGDRPLA